MNGIIENATGYLLKAGYCDFSTDAGYNPAIHTIRADVPEPAQCKEDPDWEQMHQWNGTAWVLVSQQTFAVVQAAKRKKLIVEVNEYITEHYTDGAKQSLLASWIEGVQKNYPNRCVMVQSAWDWVQTVIDYYGVKMVAILTAQTIQQVNDVTWTFDQFDDTDPLVNIVTVKNTTN